MADNSALHAAIFGSDLDDDDDDDEYAPPAAAADGADDDDDDDDKADQILSKAKNNLLLGGLKKDKKKEKKEKGASKKSSKRKADGEGGGEKRRKRLHKGGIAHGGVEGGDAAEGGGDGGVEAGADGDEAAPAGGGAAEDDPDSDSMSGSEAMEEGSKNDFEKVLSGLKAKRGGPNFGSRDKLVNDVRELQERMEGAVEEDDEASRAEPPRPALAKIAMLPEVEAIMRKKQYHEIMVDMSMLSTLARWLRPMPDGSLVSLQVRLSLIHISEPTRPY